MTFLPATPENLAAYALHLAQGAELERLKQLCSQPIAPFSFRAIDARLRQINSLLLNYGVEDISQGDLHAHCSCPETDRLTIIYLAEGRQPGTFYITRLRDFRCEFALLSEGEGVQDLITAMRRRSARAAAPVR